MRLNCLSCLFCFGITSSNAQGLVLSGIKDVCVCVNLGPSGQERQVPNLLDCVSSPPKIFIKNYFVLSPSHSSFTFLQVILQQTRNTHTVVVFTHLWPWCSLRVTHQIVMLTHRGSLTFVLFQLWWLYTCLPVLTLLVETQKLRCIRGMAVVLKRAYKTQMSIHLLGCRVHQESCLFLLFLLFVLFFVLGYVHQCCSGLYMGEGGSLLLVPEKSGGAGKWIQASLCKICVQPTELSFWPISFVFLLWGHTLVQYSEVVSSGAWSIL